MRHAFISSIFAISTLVQASPQPPYLESKESTSGGNIDILVISETKESKVYLFNCEVNKTEVRYLGDSPVCSQNVTCSRGETATNAIVEHSTLKASFNCAISSASAGCRSKTWQNCAIDKSLPEELDESCLSDNPGTTKPNCPKINSQGSSKKPEKGMR